MVQLMQLIKLSVHTQMFMTYRWLSLTDTYSLQFITLSVHLNLQHFYTGAWHAPRNMSMGFNFLTVCGSWYLVKVEFRWSETVRHHLHSSVDYSTLRCGVARIGLFLTSTSLQLWLARILNTSNKYYVTFDVTSDALW